MKDAKPCVVDPDGSHEACANSAVSVDVSRAVWSPDSAHVAFADDFHPNLFGARHPAVRLIHDMISAE